MIIFRADGNSAVGAGHVMRCLSIADAAKQLGEKCIFITAADDFEAHIASRGHEVHVLGTDYTDMEAENLSSVLEEYKPSALFVDSYYVTEDYLGNLLEYCRKNGIKLVYLDDVLAFAYPCDILVNYNIYGKKADYERLYEGRRMPQLLLGTAFAPLRAEFQNRTLRKVKQNADSVLVSTGGADSEHIAVELVKLAAKYPHTFHFVIGALNTDKECIRELAEASDNIILHEAVTSMAPLMESCDVAISAAGSTLYELCATQTPTLTYILADNQIPGAEEFSARGVMKNCGDVRDLGTEELARRLLEDAGELLIDYGKRAQIAADMQSIVDGRGAARMIDKVLQRKE